MLIFSLNAVFATLFLMAARWAWVRAWPFLRLGWTGIQAETRKPDFRRNIVSRRNISESGRFLLGGLLWAAITLGAVAFGVWFVVQALAVIL
ncbi:MAG: hypothetical protein SF029_24705 [bacterium]|nr:hypothetical protein [bacterium]